jgi:hypothetical protein
MTTRRRSLALIGAAAGAVLARPLRAQESAPVDLALVLAVDTSLSIDDGEFRLQMDGYARAFRDPRVIHAATTGPFEAIMVTFAQWSYYGSMHQSVPWIRVASVSDSLELAAAISRVERRVGSATSLSGALEGGMQLLERVGAQARRRVIDVSGDGRNNNGPDPVFARDRAISRGIVINGLPILTEDPWLDAYYRARVIGGFNAFSRPAASMADFDRAILEKLLLEIS